jgi:uncharacterized membrane protein YciS (DUF1049 family)
VENLFSSRAFGRCLNGNFALLVVVSPSILRFWSLFEVNFALLVVVSYLKILKSRLIFADQTRNIKQEENKQERGTKSVKKFYAVENFN